MGRAEFLEGQREAVSAGSSLPTILERSAAHHLGCRDRGFIRAALTDPFEGGMPLASQRLTRRGPSLPDSANIAWRETV